jgi:hypothetical protein
MAPTASQVAADRIKTPFSFKAWGKRQVSSVGTVTRLLAAQANNRGLSQVPAGTTEFLFSETFKPALWPNQPPTVWYQGIYLRGKAAGL